MFDITTSAASGTPATLAKAMARQITPQRLLATIMDGRSMWATLTIPDGVTVRGNLGSSNLFAEPGDTTLYDLRVAAARAAAEPGQEPEPVYTSTLPLRRIRWEATWEVHHADGPTILFDLVLWLAPVPDTNRGLSMDGWLDQRPIGTDLPDTALAPRFRRGQINWSASSAR